VHHRLARCEMAVPARTDDPAVDGQPPLEHDDRLRGGVAMPAVPETGRVADQVVLGTGVGVLVEEPPPMSRS
jgi:hypothetical protein